MEERVEYDVNIVKKNEALVENLTPKEFIEAFRIAVKLYNTKTAVLEYKLNTMNEEELRQLVIGVLAEGISFQQSFAEWATKLNDRNSFIFFQAAIWHIADALNELPATLDLPEKDFENFKKEYKELQISCLEHYFRFLKAFEDLAPNNLKSNVYSLKQYTKYNLYLELFK